MSDGRHHNNTWTGGDIVDNPVKFDAEVRQIKSMADKSFNLILNIPEYNKDQAKLLMDWLLDHVAVAIVRVQESDH